MAPYHSLYADESGLVHYRIILGQLVPFVKKGGRILLRAPKNQESVDQITAMISKNFPQASIEEITFQGEKRSRKALLFTV